MLPKPMPLHVSSERGVDEGIVVYREVAERRQVSSSCQYSPTYSWDSRPSRQDFRRFATRTETLDEFRFPKI